MRGNFLSGENGQIFVYWGDSSPIPLVQKPCVGWLDTIHGGRGEHVRHSEEKAKYLIDTCIVGCQLKNVVLFLS